MTFKTTVGLPNGTKVWYLAWGGERLPATIIGRGEKNGMPLYDVECHVEGDDYTRFRWGYVEQIELR